MKRKDLIYFCFSLFFHFTHFYNCWLPTVTRESAKVSGEVVPLEFKSDWRLKIWKLHQMKESKFRACCAHREFRDIFLRLFKVITFLCFTKLSELFLVYWQVLKEGNLPSKEEVLGGIKNDHFFSPYYVLHILFRRIVLKVLWGFILQVRKLSMSFLIEWVSYGHATNRRQNLDSKLALILKPMPFPLPISWSPIWKEHKIAVLCLR